MSAAPAASIHAVALAAGDLGLLVLGGSGGGKSLLAGRMLAGWPFAPVRLVADDRVILRRAGGRVVARPHPAIAGRLELRGFGIVRAPALDAVVLRAVLRLTRQPAERLPDPEQCEVAGVSLPAIDLPEGAEAFGRLLAIWPYLRDNIAAP